MTEKIYSVLHLLRPRQWVKNVFVFAAAFFGGVIADAQNRLPLVVAFVAFCAASSAIYCLNDVLDFRSDAANPARRHRPVAAGQVSRALALCVGLLLALAGIALCAVWLPADALYILAGYLALNVLYCLWLKNVAVVDVMTIALGFELRLMMGGVAASVPLSAWIVIMVFLLTLFMALAKRRDELAAAGEKARKSVRGYSREYVDLVLTMLAAVMIVAYILYTLQPAVIAQFGTDKLYVSAVFVLAGMLRYLQLAVVKQSSGSPTAIFWGDKAILGSVFGWLVCFVVVIYF